MATPPSTDSDIPSVPPPWQLRGTIYSFMTWISRQQAAALGNDPFLYHALERESAFKQGKFTGGLAMVQVIRYSESPVGPYDELLMVPGKFEHEVEKPERRKGEERYTQTERHLRLTRIYVSQKKTCYNGRSNWNIPKHIARFTFEELPRDALKISVYPHVTNDTGVETEPHANTSPFFTAIFKPTRFVPAIPVSTSIAKYLGLDLSIAQPPLPEGKGAQGELPGTKRWCALLPCEYSAKTSIGWWDLKQHDEGYGAEGGRDQVGEQVRSDGARNDGTVHKNFWPGFGRWRIGIVMKDALIDFPEGRHWIDVAPTATAPLLGSRI